MQRGFIAISSIKPGKCESVTVSQEEQIVFQEVEPMSGQQGIDYSALNLVYREDKGISKMTPVYVFSGLRGNKYNTCQE